MGGNFSTLVPEKTSEEQAKGVLSGLKILTLIYLKGCKSSFYMYGHSDPLVKEACGSGPLLCSSSPSSPHSLSWKRKFTKERDLCGLDRSGAHSPSGSKAAILKEERGDAFTPFAVLCEALPTCEIINPKQAQKSIFPEAERIAGKRKHSKIW